MVQVAFEIFFFVAASLLQSATTKICPFGTYLIADIPSHYLEIIELECD